MNDIRWKVVDTHSVLRWLEWVSTILLSTILFPQQSRVTPSRRPESLRPQL